MKLTDLERHLRQQGCLLYREGGAHTIWLNPQRRKIATYRVIGKSRRGRCEPFASNSRFHTLEA